MSTSLISPVKKAAIRRMALIGLQFFFAMAASAQMVGGRQNGQGAPKEVKASELTKGGFTSDVSLFTGALSSSYSLGSVSTPDGLSFALDMNYSSSIMGGDNAPVASGIPYGEGWTLALPSITISSETYFKYTETQFNSLVQSSGDNNVVSFTNAEAGGEGDLFTFSPRVYIPGVINENFIFKYYDTKNQQAVFVPFKFDTYIEARLNDQTWQVVLPNGNVYLFTTVQLGVRNASNQRVGKDPVTGNSMADNPAILFNTVIPKEEVLQWYCSEIFNPNSGSGQKISFIYQQYGQFDYYKEYLQPRLKAALQATTGATSLIDDSTQYDNISDNFFAAPLDDGSGISISGRKYLAFVVSKDILLTDIYSSDWQRGFDRLELKYKTQPTTGSVNLLTVGQAGVYRKDSLYNYSVVYSQGVESTELALLGLSAVPSNNTGFSSWWRYNHIKSSAAQTLNLGTEVPFVDPNNPYIGIYNNNTSNPCLFRSSLASSMNIAFDHGFLESPRIGTALPPGDIYELRSLIYNGDVAQLNSDGFCNFDINVVSGSTPLSGSQYVNANSSFPQTGYWNTERQEQVFSTFNQAVKWNSLSNNTTSNTQQSLVTSNHFVLPNLPTQFGGFNIQIGPGNSDHDFSYSFATTPPASVSAHTAYWNERYVPNFTGTYFSNDLEPCDPMRNNFGVGLPWHTMRKTMALMDNGDLSSLANRYKFWWKSPGEISSRANIPTRADAQVQLKALVLIRYSKNTYMLTEVNHYVINGKIGGPTGLSGQILTSRLKLSYEIKRDTLINNRIYPNTATASEPGVIRNVILLKKIQQMPTNASLGNQNIPNLADSLLPTTQFVYTKLTSGFYKDSARTNTNMFVLSQITDALGGKTTYTFYPLTDQRTPVVYRNKWRVVQLNANASVSKTPSLAVQITPLVASKTVSSETDASNPKRWDYNYINPIRISEQIPLPANFRNVGYHFSFGFETTVVTDPASSVGKPRTQTKLTHYNATESNGLLFGKVKKTEVFDEYGRFISTTEMFYKVNMAYFSATHRNSSTIVDPDLGEYDSYQLTNPVQLSAEADIRAAVHYIYSLEGHMPTAIPNLYRHSYFVRLIKTTQKEFDYTVSNTVYNVVDYVNISRPRTSGHTSNLRTSNPNSLPTCGYSSQRTSFISTTTDYEYWDADSSGRTKSNGYKQLIDFVGAQYIQLAFEPSWMLYKKTTTSTENAGTWAAEENYYYYDIINQLGAVYAFDAVYLANLQRNRSLSYQTRVTTKKGNEVAVARSLYSFHDYRWNQNPDEVLTIQTINYSGPPCPPGTPTPTPDPFNACIKYFGQPPPPGYVLSQDASGQWVYCPGTGGTGSPTTLRKTVPGPNDPPPPPAPNQGGWLAGKLFFRAQWAQVDTLPSTQYAYLDATNAKIMRFEQVNISTGVDQYLPRFAYPVLELYRVNKRNELGLVKEEQDESGVLTKYWYRSIRTIFYKDIANPCNNNFEYIMNERGLPYAVTQGYTRSDSLRTEVKYNIDMSIDSLISPNGEVLSYTYDQFERLKQTRLNNKLRSVNNYHYYNNTLSASFAQRAAMNYVESYVLLNSNSNVAERSRAYMDPLGRKYAILSQVSPNYTTNALDSIMVHAGQTDYDNWGRAIRQYKSFKETNNNQAVGFSPKFNSQNTALPQTFTETEYEANARSRALRSARYGQDITNGYTTNTSYEIIAGNVLVAEVGGSFVTHLLQMMPTGSTANYRFRKQSVIDEDGKRTISYTNALGQVVATKSYISGNQFAVTVFIYDSRGNMIKSVNPILEQTVNSYNLLGGLYKKTSPNSGTCKYMYNKKGQVVLEQDANGAAGTDNGGVPYMRQYTYDVYGRPLLQEKVNATGTYSPLHYANTTGTYTLVFSSATTCDFAFNMTKATPPSGQTPVDPYSLVSGNVTEKAFGYHFAVSSSFGSSINSTLHANLGTVRTATPQSKLKGRLSYDISYNATGQPIQYHLYSYTDEGQVSYEMQQFNEAGITAASRGICGIVRNTAYNLRGSVTAQTVDADANNTNELSYSFIYDGWNRLKEATLNAVKLADYAYNDALGLVTRVRYYDKNATCSTTVAVDTLYYNYDVRDRLVSMKSHLFEEYLYYDAAHPQTADTSFKVNASQNWNGNINASKAVYRCNRASNNPNIFNGATYYGYTYDGMNRLTAADASVMDVLTNPSVWTPKRRYGDESYTYDKAGNILTLTRGAYYHNSVVNPANWVANWTYVYQTGTSKLTRIDSSSVARRNYTYDANGNMRTDSYKGLTASVMNRANLPVENTVNGKLLKNLYNTSDTRIYKQNVTDNKKTFYWLTTDGKTIGVLTQGTSWATGTWEWLTGIGKQIGTAREFTVNDHLGNSRVTYRTTLTCANAVTYNLENVIDYYPFGKTLREFSTIPVEKWKFNGNEREEETSYDYFNARFYDSDIGRFQSIDPKINPFNSEYVAFSNNPIFYNDPCGDTIRVTTKEGTFLFNLDDKSETVTTYTAKALYDKGIQWFEPLADNYMPMLNMNKDIGTMDGVKHFSWQNIEDFATEDRWMSSYLQNGSGDWKSQPEGAEGFFLVTVDGKPYWADAIGQIAFAVDYFTDVYEDNGDPAKSVRMTIDKAREFGEGKLGGTRDNSNGYDTYFVLRAALWASRKYTYSPTLDKLVVNNNVNMKYIENSISSYLQQVYLTQ